MKALTLWQPWASLVVESCKPYEFRGWRAPQRIVGERIVIHASARKPDMREVEQLLRLLRAGGRYAAQTCLQPVDEAKALLERGSWPLAAGLGTVVVGEPKDGLAIGVDFGAIRVNDSSRDYHANWGWPMLQIERWTEPVPMRGAQGLWNWPTPAEAFL